MGVDAIFPLHVVTIPGLGGMGLVLLLCCLPRGRKRTKAPTAKGAAAAVCAGV